MFRTKILKVPATVQEEDSLDSHNAKSMDLSELPSTFSMKPSAI